MKKKVLFLLPTLSHGGAERVISEISSHILDSVEPVLVLFERRISFPFRGRIISLEEPLSLNPFLRVWRFFVRLAKFKKVLAKEKPDAVVSAGASANAISIFSRPQPVVRVDMHISESRKGLRGLPFKLFVRFFFKKAKVIVPVSKAIAEDLQENFRIPTEKMRVIYNPVNVERIQTLSLEPLPPELENIFSHPVIITMGRLQKQKGQWHLLEAFARVKEKIGDAKLLILGEGDLRELLEGIAQKLGIEQDVHFLGWQDNPFAFLKRARIFVLSSLWEGLPDVLLEAMASGKPVISFDCNSGPREIIAPSTAIGEKAKTIEYGEYGILVPLGNEELLAKAIVELLQNEEEMRNLSLKSRQRALDFDIKKIIPLWYSLF